MRILVLMNMYPPHSDGGYPLLCLETVEELKARGHEVLVLTSTMGLNGRRRIEKDVWRVFEYCPDNKRNEPRSFRLIDLLRWYVRERREQRYLDKAIASFEPDAAFVWATKGMSYALAIRLMAQKFPLFAYVCGYWLIDHNKHARKRRQHQFWAWGESARGVPGGVKRILKALLAKGLGLTVEFKPLAFDGVAFNNPEMIAGLESPAWKRPPVQIYDSTSVDDFAGISRSGEERPKRFLFVGRFHPSKDPLILVKALELLQSTSAGHDAELTLVGWPHDKSYVDQLEDAIRSLPNPDRVRFREPVAFGEMPALFADHDVLVVPSQADPLPRIAAEAMAAAMPVIVSDRCGISRLLKDRQDALIFPAGDEQQLAEAMKELMENLPLVRDLSEKGRCLAVDYFSTQRMVNEIERFLVDGTRSEERAGHPSFESAA